MYVRTSALSLRLGKPVCQSFHFLWGTPCFRGLDVAPLVFHRFFLIFTSGSLSHYGLANQSGLVGCSLQSQLGFRGLVVIEFLPPPPLLFLLPPTVFCMIPLMGPHMSVCSLFFLLFFFFSFLLFSSPVLLHTCTSTYGSSRFRCFSFSAPRSFHYAFAL